MELPLQITSRNVELDDAHKTKIAERAEKLNHFFDRITGCRVAVETEGARHHGGAQYVVRIDLTVPGEEIVIRREPHPDLTGAIGDAFDAARRQIEDYVRRRREHAPSVS